MESGGTYESGRYKQDYYKGTQSMQQNALVMNKKIMSILAERDAAIKERNEAVIAKKEALSARDKALEERDKAIEERDNAIMERDSAFNAIQYRESNLNYILSRCSSSNQLPDPCPISVIPKAGQPGIQPEFSSGIPSKRKKKDLNRQVTSPGKKCRKDCWDSNEIVVRFDETTMQIPVCTCTGTARQCYKWGNGGWQSSCCTTVLSQYPLPQLPNKRHSRIGGRKMSGGVFLRLLSRLASEGHELCSSPIDLKDYWARHGTNRYITIK